MMKKLLLRSLLLLAAAGAVYPGGGSGDREVSADPGLTVFVSILPQKTFVERIGGGRVNVSVMVPPGRSPETYEPTPRQMTSLGGADVFFTIGVQFERVFIGVVTRSLPDLPVVDTAAGIRRRPIEDHGDEGEGHEGEALDPHVWLSPVLVKIQARTIAETLGSLDPAGRELYEANLSAFLDELDAVHEEIARVLAPVKDGVLFVSHPAFGYFADEFGLVQVAIETGGKEPSAAELEKIIERAKASKVRVIFVQPEFPRDSAAAVAQAIGGAVVTVEPLDADYFGLLRRIASEAEKALQ